MQRRYYTLTTKIDTIEETDEKGGNSLETEKKYPPYERPLFLVIITLIPMLKLVILMILYQCVAAVLQPVCDKRIVSCISDMARGHKILLSIAASAIVLFVVTVAVVCASTNVTYYAG